MWNKLGKPNIYLLVSVILAIFTSYIIRTANYVLQKPPK
jgi:hypothetical protein